MLTPEARAAVEKSAASTPVHSPDFDIEAERLEARALAAQQPREDVAATDDVDAGGVPCRLYRPAVPAGGGAPGVVVHLHGGGFVLNDVEVHDSAARALANRTRRPVLSVDYRLAPEHPWPAAPDDVDTVLGWLDREGAALGLDGPAYAHGDSAGANLALVAALRHPGRLRALALVYPFLDPTCSGESHRTETEGFDVREAQWYWRQYCGGDESLLGHPDLAPLLSEGLAALPPTLVVTAEHDLVRDDGERLAAILAQEGVPVVATRYLGQVHGFWRHPEVFAVVDPVLRQTADFLDRYA